eukprot:TRINITY_DN12483_c0_g1_i3.p3 TRINITY_DN12483_c0_g1~~TRINITY_DN12483_c0_g1_i3.p3  ORF type:complete len:106 (-),score=16.44 TRINITY_DN12483_c0_g1_i3:132-449(-)
MVSMVVDGRLYMGSRSEDNRRLVWGDGDVWALEDEELDLLNKVASKSLPDQPPWATAVEWGSWKMHLGTAGKRPTFPNSKQRPAAGSKAKSARLPPLRGVLWMRR